MNSELSIPQEITTKNEPHQSVRIFPYGVRSLPDLLKDVSMLEKDKKLSLFEVYMGQKTDLSDHTKGLIMPFGGQIRNDGMKNIEKAGLARLNEQSTLTVIPYSDPNTDEFAFEYKVKAEEPNIRVYFKSALVVSPDILQAIHPQNDRNIGLEIVKMSLNDFRESTKSGEFNGFKLAGVTNYSSENSEILTSSMDSFRRETYLKMMFLSIEEQEKKFSDKFKKRLILDAFRSGIKFEDKNICIDNILKLEDRLERDAIFGRISLESVIETIDANGKLDEILEASYNRLIRESYMEYFREYEKKQYTKFERSDEHEVPEFKKDIIKNELDLIKSRIVDGNFGLDLMHFIPLYTQTDIHPEARTTRLINTSARFIRDAINECLPKLHLDNIKSFSDAKTLIEDPTVPLSKKFDFYKKMDEQMLELLSEKLGKTKRYVTRTWFEAQKFIPDIGETVKNVDPNLARIYQFHELRNEVSNASLMQTIFLGLGIDTKTNKGHLSQIRFEALRQMAIFSKFLFESDVYERKSQKGINPIDLAINNFFGSVETIEHKEFIDEKTGMCYEKPIERRRDSKGRMFIIDEKPTKPLESFIRKSFETKHTNILDLHSANVIVADEQYKDLPQEEKILLVNNIADEFIQYLKDNFSDFKISISGDKNTFENFTAFQNGKVIEKNGKRTGSQGSRIVRRKMYIKMSRQEGDKVDDYSYELVFYPFEKLATMSEGEMLGWMDKIADDPTYVGKRLMETLQKTYGLKSLYELFFPPAVYPELVKKMRGHVALENK